MKANLIEFKINSNLQIYEQNLLRQIEKFQNVIFEEFKKRNLLKNEVRI